MTSWRLSCSTCRPASSWCSSPGPTRGFRSRGCGPPARWSRSGCPSCASRRCRPPRWSRPSPVPSSPRLTWPTSSSGPRAGQPASTWRRCHCGGTPNRAPSSASSRATTASSWISWPRRSSAGSRPRSGSSWRGRRSSTGSARRCAMPWPGRTTRPTSSISWSGRTSSSSRWTTPGAGTASTACSRRCSPASWPGTSPASCPRCTSGRAPGTRPRDGSTRRSPMSSPPVTSPVSWSSSRGTGTPT